MSPRALLLVPLGPPFAEPDLVEWLAREIPLRLSLDPRIADAAPLPSGSPPAADAALDSLVDLLPPRDGSAPSEWALGLTAARLEGPGGASVIGEAALGGAWALLSTAPLTPPDPFLDRELLRERLLKEALHELGHVAGLPHCDSGFCLMSPSRDAAEVDRKEGRFCPSCVASLAALDPPLVDG